MKYLIVILTGILFFGCKRQAYQNQDVKYMSGTWKIVKVTSYTDQKTSLYDNFGTFTVNEDGTGILEVNSHDYTPSGEKVKCSLIVQTIKGIDYSIDLYGLKKLDDQGKPVSYLCDNGKLHIRIEKLKKKKMTFRFDQQLANLTPCSISGYYLNKGEILWFLERQ